MMDYFAHPDHLAFTWKGRVALFAILKALGVGPGDEVVVPAYTCVVVPNVILYLAQTRSTPTSSPILTRPARTIEPRITARTRVIIAQNTFGLSADLSPILELAQHRTLSVVEDSAHGLGSYYQQQPCGALTHASFFSTQWSKPISTGLGGIAYSPDKQLARQIQQIVMAMPRCPRLAAASLSVQRCVRPLADRPAWHYRLVDRYRQLTQRLGWLSGSSGVGELAATSMPRSYLRQMSRSQRTLFQRALTRLADTIRQRRIVSERFDELLRFHGFSPPARPDNAEHGMLRYAFRVANKAAFLASARASHVPIGDWFSSPLHPVCGDLRPWGYRPGTCPVAEQACREVVNLYPRAVLYGDQRALRRLLGTADPVAAPQPTAA